MLFIEKKPESLCNIFCPKCCDFKLHSENCIKYWDKLQEYYEVEMFKEVNDVDQYLVHR